METNFDKLKEMLTKWDAGGTRILSNGAIQICHVPHVAPQAWLHELYAPLTLENIHELEKQVQNTFPVVFKDFLLHTNGINLFSDTLSISGFRFSFERVGDAAVQPYHLVTSNKNRPFLCPKSWIFFGRYSWDGSRLFFDISEGRETKVYRCKKDSKKILNEWASFWEWLLSEVDRLSQMYDEKGIKLDKSAPTVPTV